MRRHWVLKCIAVGTLTAFSTSPLQADVVAVRGSEGTDRLSPDLRVLVESEGTLRGITDDGMAVLEVPNETKQALRTNPLVEEFSTRPAKFNEEVQLLISYDGKDGAPTDDALQKAGFTKVEDYQPGSFLVVSPQQQLSSSALRKLLTDQAVAYVQPSYRINIPPNERGPKIQNIPAVNPTATPNDPLYPQLWGMDNIEAPAAWDNITSSPSVVVAVIDTGVDYGHEDLAGNMWTNPGEIAGNGIDDDGNGIVDDVFGADFFDNDGDPMDGDDHGTHCSGTIAGVGDNAIGVTGVTWDTQIMALRFLGPFGGSTQDAIKCIDYAVDKGAHIISASWGGGPFSAELEAAIARAESAGVLFVAAAGNTGGNDNDVNPHFPSSYDLDNVISVGAINSSDSIASFSCFGKQSVDIGAPGVNIISTISGNNYASFSGTSMATPHVSGAAALIWASMSSPDADSVRDAIYKNARQVSSLTGFWGHNSVVSAAGGVQGGVLNVGFLGDGATPPPPPAAAKFAATNFGFGQNVTGDATVATVTLRVDQPGQFLVSANTSITSTNDALITTGFTDQPDAGAMWYESLRFASVPANGWVNVGSTITVDLPAGEHQFRWNMWAGSNELELDSGSISVQVYPAENASGSKVDVPERLAGLVKSEDQNGHLVVSQRKSVSRSTRPESRSVSHRVRPSGRPRR